MTVDEPPASKMQVIPLRSHTNDLAAASAPEGASVHDLVPAERAASTPAAEDQAVSAALASCDEMIARAKKVLADACDEAESLRRRAAHVLEASERQAKGLTEATERRCMEMIQEARKATQPTPGDQMPEELARTTETEPTSYPSLSFASLWKNANAQDEVADEFFAAVDEGPIRTF